MAWRDFYAMFQLTYMDRYFGAVPTIWSPIQSNALRAMTHYCYT